MFSASSTQPRSLLLAGVLFLSLLAWAGCGGESSETGEAGEDAEVERGPTYTVGDAITDTTTAIVIDSEYGTDTITTAAFQDYSQMLVQGVPPQRRAMITDSVLHSNVVERLVTQHAVTGAARAEGIEPDSAVIRQRMQAQRQQFADEDGTVDEAAFTEALASRGLTRDSLRSIFADQVIMRRQQQNMVSDAEAPSEDSILAVSERNRRFQIQQILLQLPEDAPENTVDSTRQVAEALIDSAEAGTNFDSLVTRHSDGRGASRGGRLQPVTKSQIEPAFGAEFGNAAFALQDSGDVAPEPIRSSYGFHVIRLLDRGQPQDTSQVRQTLMQEKQQEAFEEELRALQENVTVRVNPQIVKAGLEAS
jgi:peptidyl-prolyl cis-trans isomerase C